MRQHRRTEVNVLGYRIERVSHDELSGDGAYWYEVLAPETQAVVGRFAHRAEAEREVVSRELAPIAVRPRAARAADCTQA